MKHLAFILLLIASEFSYSQKIHFADCGWYLEGMDSAGRFIQQYNHVLPTHELNGLYYYDLFSGFTVRNGVGLGGSDYLVREDTVLGIVYYLDLDTAAGHGQIERILYKYNVAVGDTVHSYNYSYPLTVIDSVVKVDSVMIYGDYYKVITMKKLVDPYNYNFGSDSIHTYIEGVGGISGEFYRITNLVARAKIHIKCIFLHDGRLPDINLLYPYPGINDTTRFKTDCSFISVPEVFASTTTVTITPNPVWGEATISYPASIATGQLQVYDAMGRVVYQATLSGGHSNTLPMGTARPGLYFYRLSDAGSGRVYNGRFVKE